MASAPQIQTTDKPKIKHDWYQTETHVIVTVLIKNAPKNDVKVEFGSNSLSVSSPIPDSNIEYSLEIDLCHEIDPSQSTFLVMASKIEIKMKKIQGLRWDVLERCLEQPLQANVKPIPKCIIDSSGPNCPSSYPYKKDWNQIERELKKQEADEKPEGEEALKKLFEQIYDQGNDEVRKAMNKSFSESGGTVLSTNWTEVGQKEVTVQPPDGTEFKKWE